MVFLECTLGSPMFCFAMIGFHLFAWLASSPLHPSTSVVPSPVIWLEAVLLQCLVRMERALGPLQVYDLVRMLVACQGKRLTHSYTPSGCPPLPHPHA